MIVKIVLGALAVAVFLFVSWCIMAMGSQCSREEEQRISAKWN